MQHSCLSMVTLTYIILFYNSILYVYINVCLFSLNMCLNKIIYSFLRVYDLLITESKTFNQDFLVITTKTSINVSFVLHGQQCFHQVQIFNHTVVCDYRSRYTLEIYILSGLNIYLQNK